MRGAKTRCCSSQNWQLSFMPSLISVNAEADPELPPASVTDTSISPPAVWVVELPLVVTEAPVA